VGAYPEGAVQSRRVVFSGRLFPILLLALQLVVTFVFFFWPAAQALAQSVQQGMRLVYRPALSGSKISRPFWPIPLTHTGRRLNLGRSSG
jgi:ABC-type sugar transport system permease subunit